MYTAGGKLVYSAADENRRQCRDSAAERRCFRTDAIQRGWIRKPRSVKQYCAGCHSERGKAGGLSLAAFDVARGGAARRRRREDDPQAARRHDAAARRAASRRGGAARARRRARDRDRRSAAAARRIPAAGRSSGSIAPSTRARSRICSRSTSTSPALLPPDTISQGFDNVADVAGAVAGADGRLSARREPDHRARGRRSARPSRAKRTTACRKPRRSCAASTARRSARAAASRSCTRFPADGDYVFRIDLHGNADGFLFGGTGDRRADRRVDRRRAQGAARHRSAHGARSTTSLYAEDAADSRHAPARSASPPRSCSGSKGRSTI